MRPQMHTDLNRSNKVMSVRAESSVFSEASLAWLPGNNSAATDARRSEQIEQGMLCGSVSSVFICGESCIVAATLSGALASLPTNQKNLE